MIPIEENVEQLLDEAIETSRKYLEKNKSSEAIIILEQLLKVDPHNKKATQLLGVAKYADRAYAESIEIFEELLKEDPNNPEHHNNIALSYACTAQPELAKHHLKLAVKLNPLKSHYHSNLGLQYRQFNDLDKAIECFKKAIELDDRNHYAWINLGSVYGRLKQLDMAIDCFKSALQANPEDKHIHVNLGYAYLLQKRYQEGWAEYEHRMGCFKQLEHFDKIYKSEKRWSGKEDIKNKNIVVYGEQGVGDFMQFSRFISPLKQKGCNVLLHIPDNLIDLYKENRQLGHCAEKTIYKDDEYDYVCSVMSLPYLLRLSDLGESKPYITVPKANFNQYDKYFKVGICWAGNPQHPNDPERSCKLFYFKSLNQLENVKLFSLQKETNKRKYTFFSKPIDLTEGCQDLSVVDMSPYMTDFKKTAMIINALDLIITVDTAILHLSGALGKRAWGLIPHNPDWRWGMEGDSTPWYDSVKLFRQPSSGDWESVFEKINFQLKEII